MHQSNILKISRQKILLLSYFSVPSFCGHFFLSRSSMTNNNIFNCLISNFILLKKLISLFPPLFFHSQNHVGVQFNILSCQLVRNIISSFKIALDLSFHFGSHCHHLIQAVESALVPSCSPWH